MYEQVFTYVWDYLFSQKFFFSLHRALFPISFDGIGDNGTISNAIS